MLTCSCHDYSVKQKICKHIHSVMRLQQQKNKNDDVSPEEFQDLIFHSPVEQNNSPNDQKKDREPTNDDFEQLHIEKSKVLSKILAISGATATAKL